MKSRWMNLTRTKTVSDVVTAEVEITQMKTEEVALSYQPLLRFQADGHH